MATNKSQRPAIIEVIGSISLGIALLIIILVSIVFRSVKRYQALGNRTVRFEPNNLLRKQPSDERRMVIVRGIERSERIMEYPPQYGRRLPVILQTDVRGECEQMLQKVRSLANTTAASSNQVPQRFMPTMRVALAHFKGMYSAAEAADYLHTYEHILYGPPAEAWPEYISEDDLSRMRRFFEKLVAELER